jgi:DNA-binding response OmpR family regulator
MNVVELQQQVAALRAQLLRIENQMLELTGDGLVMQIRGILKLSRKPALLLAALARNTHVDRALAKTVLYGDGDAPATPRIAEVYINKIRQSLRPHYVEVKPIWGIGWHIESGDKARLFEVLGL